MACRAHEVPDVLDKEVIEILQLCLSASVIESQHHFFAPIERGMCANAGSGTPGAVAAG
jgi:hypothetical protein